MELTGEGHWKRSRNMKDELMYWNKDFYTAWFMLLGVSIASIIREIDEQRLPETNLSSEIRVWVLKQLLKTSK